MPVRSVVKREKPRRWTVSCWSLALIGNASGQTFGAERGPRSEAFPIKASDQPGALHSWTHALYAESFPLELFLDRAKRRRSESFPSEVTRRLHIP